MPDREQWAAWSEEFTANEPPLHWIEARYGGTCLGCGERYEVGELIAFDDVAEGWICWDCGQQ